MVRFSCFSTTSFYQRPKKVQHMSGKMYSTPHQKSEDQEKKVQFGSPSTNPKIVDNNFSNSNVEQTLSSHRDCWKSEYLHGDFRMEDGKEFLQLARMKKSQSLGSILDKEGGFSGGDVVDNGDGVDPQFSFKYYNEKCIERTNKSLEGNIYPESYNHESLGINFDNQHKENDLVEPFGMTANHVHHGSIFSIEVLEQFDGSNQADVDEQSTDFIDDSGCLSSDNHHVIERSCSAISLRGHIDNSTEGDGIHELMHRSRSFGNLDSRSGGMTELHEEEEMRLHSRSFGNLESRSGGTTEMHEEEEVIPPELTHIGLRVATNSYNLLQESYENRKGMPGQVDSWEERPVSNTSGGLIEVQDEHGNYWSERFDSDNETNVARYHSHDDVSSANERRESETDEKIKKLQPESPTQNYDELDPREFNIRRIEEWISQIDVVNGSIVEETGESSGSFSSQEPQAEVSTPFIKPDAKSSLGMEAAYNYVSSLTAASSSAQMVKLGLVAVPSLSAFASLRMLNLSGNSIVRITPGSLPRGLHMLNLSKNNIAIIEGLRDLTHLRILDLSYNRIVRIGHGLASCSFLKELYLAGNKISEVEGLHRLLKLNILDMRGNKISTAKGIGQLAANYGSMQAINLDGNPAQRNVGDEHLKKYLLSLLPNLGYYNRKAIKASGTKEISDHRPSRSVSRTDLKIPRRGSHGSGLYKLALNQSRTSHAVGSSLKQSRSRESYHARLPPMGSKPTIHLPDTEKKPVSLQPSNPIRRSRSEGTL